MTPGSIPRYKWILAAGDYLCIICSFLLAMILIPGKLSTLNLVNLGTFGLFAVAWVFAMEFNNLYNHSVVMNRSEQTVLLFKAACSAFIVVVLTQYLFRPENWLGSRPINALIYPAALILLGIWRMVIFRALWKRGSLGERYRKRTAIIGASKRALNLASRISYKPDADINVIGFIDDDVSQKNSSPHLYRILGTKHDLKAIAKKHDIHNFVIATDAMAAGEILDIASQCTKLGAQVDVASASTSIWNHAADYSIDAEFPVIHLHGSRNNLAARTIKRTVDIILSGLGLLTMLPLFIVIAILIKTSSKGPVIYRSRRVGKLGKTFNFYKFRSMRPASEHHDAHALKGQYESYIKDNQQVGKIVNDDRVTRIGKIMRKTSIDELPQLWNVMRGDMSLVGPRPCLPHEYALYSEWHKNRLSVLPGCTGLWQVSDRKATSFNDMVLLDYFYIENMSPWFDVQIIIKTIPVMIFGRGDF